MHALPVSSHANGIVFAPRAATWRRRPGGAIDIESPLPLGEFRRELGSYLRQWARDAGERPFLCQRETQGAGWRRITYAQALQQARSIAQWLIDRDLGQDHPVLILSPASIEHGLLALGCLLAGVPFAPVSPVLSQTPGGRRKLRSMAAVLQPALVFAQDDASFSLALAELQAERSFLAVCAEAAAGGDSIAFASLLSSRATDAVERRGASIHGDTVVKYLFTSGSTGTPKAVPNTHRMLCANQRMMQLLVRGDPAEPPVFVDWLPWSHTFGGNVTFHWILRDGGTLYIDAGRPLAGAFETTLANLREVRPTHCFNVPAGYAMLADALEADPALAAACFSRLRFCFYGGASLPQDTWNRMQALAIAHTGRALVFTTGCGSTETGPIGTFLHWPVQRAGIIGLPAPGVQARLVPVSNRFELRLRGPNIFTGYLRQPEATSKAFDEDGYYRTGDAVQLVDPDDPAQGLVFDGRVAEDFKLATGTFVQVGNVRVALVSAMSLLQDAVLTAEDRPWLGALVWLNAGACSAIGAALPTEASPLDPLLRDALCRQLATYNAEAQGSSRRVHRIRVLVEPPSSDDGELTEKGYVNQRAVIARRKAEVNALYACPLGASHIIDAPAGTWNPPAC